MKRTHFHRGASQFYDAEKPAEIAPTKAPPGTLDRHLSIETTQAITGPQQNHDGLKANEIKPGTNWEQIENKLGTNREQTGNEKTHINYALGTNWERNPEQIENETGNKLRTNRERNREQTGNKSWGLADLSGLQELAISWLFDSCRFNGSRETEPVFLTSISKAIKTTSGAAKETLKRIEKKQFIIRKKFKAGRGGWTIYEIPEPVYKDLTFKETRNKPGTNWERNREQTGNKLGAEPGTKPGTTPLSSSSYIINNLKPTTEVAGAPAREEHVWTPDDIDYSMLADIGFGRSQLLQLRDLGINRATVQKSIVYFDFELRYTESGKSIKEPLALFMKRMRHNGCWEAPEEYQKRIEHFQTRFEEREQQLQNVEQMGERN